MNLLTMSKKIQQVMKGLNKLWKKIRKQSKVFYFFKALGFRKQQTTKYF